MPTGIKRFAQFISSVFGALALFSLFAIFAYWIFAFVYFGSTGGFDGLPEHVTRIVTPLARLGLKPGPLDPTDPRSLGYHALRAFGPGLFALVPSYVCLRLWESIVPK